MSEADVLHQDAQADLADRVSGSIKLTLQTVLLIPSEQLQAAYAEETARVISDGQWKSADLAVAYLASQVEFASTPDLDEALAGRLMTAEHPGAAFGLVHLWWLVGQGWAVPEAREKAGEFAASLARGDLQSAQRVGLDEGARVATETVRFRKLAGPGACDWCLAIAGSGTSPARYHSADTVPFHRGCNCGVASEVIE